MNPTAEIIITCPECGEAKLLGRKCRSCAPRAPSYLLECPDCEAVFDVRNGHACTERDDDE